MTTKGALIFAYNNDQIDYEKIAEFNRQLILHHLNIPTTIITGNPTNANSRTFIWRDNTYEQVDWHNTDRMTAYSLSPYDETLLLDADYLIMSDNLKKYFGSAHEFQCADKVYDVTGTNTFASDRMMSKTSFPMRWATCIYFKKTEFSKSVFDMMQEVRQNYHYYGHLFNFRPTPYRNDFALSIALQLLSGYNDTENHFTFPLASVGTQEEVVDIRQDGTVVIEYDNNGKEYQTKVNGLDLHVMNKPSLIKQIDILNRKKLFWDGLRGKTEVMDEGFYYCPYIPTQLSGTGKKK